MDTDAVEKGKKVMSVNPYPGTNTGGGSNRAEKSTNHSSSQPWHRWQDWVNLVLGVWLFIAPWIWHSATTIGASATNSGWNAWVVGIIIVVMALWALSSPLMSAPEWINAIAGIWLFISPWVMGYHRVTASSAWNQWAVGVIVFILAVWAANSINSRNRNGGAGTA